MALTRDFRETVAARVQRDASFRQALFTEAINAYLAGDNAGRNTARFSSKPPSTQMNFSKRNKMPVPISRSRFKRAH
jgi:hypothetical protein